MNYVSTRDKSIKVTAAKAIAQGISAEGGLFVPDTFSLFTTKDFENMRALDYVGRAKYVLSRFLNDFGEEEIDYCVNGAYKGSFDNDEPAPLKDIGDNIKMLELWHGPTCAFKD
ncbi:MAG: threonine synthase, partial [Clostridia bacterium]|nr:threonine synthase [Clostridia bacterium]